MLSISNTDINRVALTYHARLPELNWTWAHSIENI